MRQNKYEIQPIADVKVPEPLELVPPRIDGRRNARKSIGGDKILSVPAGSVTTAEIADGAVTTPKLADNSVTNAKMADDAIKQAELDYEVVTLAFGSADTSKTAVVTSGSIIIGVYSSSVTSAPVYGELQLSISGTTLTGTRSASPSGTATITYTVILMKA